ncbi:hypothetical protein CU669_19725 [Paramagnetospirillum kuznetsovii]|uniref:Uncharacterized protein n=1 Tax=Paramagnetospirillum kuznetsovii TaxID=2053833 RepID=A0A364NSW4_9PROT|nr:hypothetical protein CU669_19725 [Paramagnetospirillum kuznetsovii]
MVVLPLMGAVSAQAADMGSRLVVGGASIGTANDPLRSSSFGETRLPLISGGGFSLGAVTEPSAATSVLTLPFASGRGNLAVGGYMAYGLNETRLSSSLRSDGTATRANISAAYAGGLLGAGGTAALSLDSVWTKPQSFSLNRLQPSSALSDPYDAGSDLNLSLSLMRQMTPSFSVGGVAQANRLSGSDQPTTSGFMLGAGLGYRF